MHPQTDLAARLLRFEQQLHAYQKLHREELAELWRVLDACKRELTASLPDEADGPPASPAASSAEIDPQEDTDNDK